jgi:hypothetical protein
MTALKEIWSQMRWPFRGIVVLVAPLVPLTLWYAIEAVNQAVTHAIGPNGTYVLGLYFLPTILALMRKGTTNRGSVFLINLLTGWTVIGWFVALGLAGSGSATRREAA